VKNYDKGNYDEEDGMAFEKPIEWLRPPTEKERELIAWKLAKDRRKIVEDSSAYVYVLVGNFAKALTEPTEFRDNDVSLATKCAYMIMTILKKLEENWRQKNEELLLLL